MTKVYKIIRRSGVYPKTLRWEELIGYTESLDNLYRFTPESKFQSPVDEEEHFYSSFYISECPINTIPYKEKLVRIIKMKWDENSYKILSVDNF